MKLYYLQDPAHGWIAAPVSLVRDLGIADQISAYSYHDAAGGMVYLEEDCDAPILVRAMRKAGIEPDLSDVYVKHDAHCRALPRWRA